MLLALPTAALAQDARPAKAAKKALSAQAFSDCREQEKIGPSAACWALFLQRYKDTGSEAEVAYAEEHAKVLEAPPASTPPPGSQAEPATSAAEPSQKGVGFLTVRGAPTPLPVLLDGVPLGFTPIVGRRVPAGVHTIVLRKAPTSESRRVEIHGAAQNIVDFSTPPPAEAPAAAAPTNDPPARAPTEQGLPTSAQKEGDSGPPPEKQAIAVTGDVLDFCALAPATSNTKFVKQRVVIFALADAEQLNRTSAIGSVDGAELMRDVFMARFPLGRFHNVTTARPAKGQWATAESIRLDDAIAHLGVDEKGISDFDKRDRMFAAYSLGCADYLVAPIITHYKTEAREVKSKGTSGSISTLKLSVEGTAGVFKRRGQVFEKLASVSAAVPSFVDEASDMAAESIPDYRVAGVSVVDLAMKAPELPKYVSAVPDLDCIGNNAAKDGIKAVAQCATRGQGRLEQAVAASEERLGPVCRQAREQATPKLMTQCEVRARAAQLARAVQKQTRGVDGWRLFDVLAFRKGAPSIALGRNEGVATGHGFEALDGDGERVGFFKATRIGRGGTEGDSDRTELELRAGDATQGAKVQEYPQIGLVVTGYGSVGALTYNYARTNLNNASYFLPSAVYGGGATVGYDLSSAVSWPEFYFRIGVTGLVGAGVGTKVTLLPFDAWLEKGLYLGPRLLLAASIGFNVTHASVDIATSDSEKTSGNAIVCGPAGRLALDILLHPDWDLTLDFVTRVPLSRASYSASDEAKPIPGPWAAREDHFAFVGGQLGLGKTF